MIWPGELIGSGEINHALVFGYPHTLRDSFVAPASWSDGWEDAEYALPLGAHLQLDPDLDLKDPVYGLMEWEKKIGRALQMYGMYLHDTGSVGSIIELEAVHPASFSSDPYLGIDGFAERGYTDGYVTLSPVFVRSLRVLSPGEIKTRMSHPRREGAAHEELYYY